MYIGQASYLYCYKTVLYIGQICIIHILLQDCILYWPGMYLYYHIGQACINTATGFQCVLARPVLDIATGLELGQQHQSEQARQNLVSQTRGQANIIFRQFDTRLSGGVTATTLCPYRNQLQGNRSLL